MKDTAQQLPERMRPAAAGTPARARIMLYGPDLLKEEEIADLEQVGNLRGQAPMMWLNIDGPCTPRALAHLGSMFSLHPLALEDVVHTHQRAKVEEYADHHFVVSRMATLADGSLVTEHLSLFFGKGFVITFQDKPGDCLDSVRERIRRSTGGIRDLASAHLAYAILDAVIDGYFPVLEHIEEQLEDMEEVLDQGNRRPPSSHIVKQSHKVRKEIQRLRQAVSPTRDVIHRLSLNVKSVGEETRIHLRDCYDHVMRILEILETHRESCLAVRELYQARLSNHTNEVMKMLTIITTLFTPLTFIAGVYGMNFNPDTSPLNMPELNWAYGYLFALGLMAAVFIGMLGFLYRRGWLASRDYVSGTEAEPAQRAQDAHPPQKSIRL